MEQNKAYPLIPTHRILEGCVIETQLQYSSLEN